MSTTDLITGELNHSQRLKGAVNYVSWSANMKKVLKSKGLSKYLDMVAPKAIAGMKAVTEGPDKAPEIPEITTDFVDKWETNDAKAQMVIVRNISPELEELIIDCDTTKAMWTTLETQFKGTGYNLKYQYFTAISEIQFRSFKDVDSFIVRFKSLKANLASLHIGLPDEIYTFIFINALSDAFPVWADRQRSRGRDGENAPTLPTLMDDISDEARIKSIESKGATEGTGIVLYTGKDSGRSARKPQFKGKGKEKSSEKCSHCSKTGYSPDSCWVMHPEKAPSWIKEKAQNAAKLDSKSGPDRSSTPYVMMANTYPLTLSDWVVDTGASRHTCNDLDLFDTIDLSPG